MTQPKVSHRDDRGHERHLGIIAGRGVDNDPAATIGPSVICTQGRVRSVADASPDVDREDDLAADASPMSTGRTTSPPMPPRCRPGGRPRRRCRRRVRPGGRPRRRCRRRVRPGGRPRRRCRRRFDREDDLAADAAVGFDREDGGRRSLRKGDRRGRGSGDQRGDDANANRAEVGGGTHGETTPCWIWDWRTRMSGLCPKTTGGRSRFRRTRAPRRQTPARRTNGGSVSCSWTGGCVTLRAIDQRWRSSRECRELAPGSRMVAGPVGRTQRAECPDDPAHREWRKPGARNRAAASRRRSASTSRSCRIPRPSTAGSVVHRVRRPHPPTLRRLRRGDRAGRVLVVGAGDDAHPCARRCRRATGPGGGCDPAVPADDLGHGQAAPGRR